MPERPYTPDLSAIDIYGMSREEQDFLANLAIRTATTSITQAGSFVTGLALIELGWIEPTYQTPNVLSTTLIRFTSRGKVEYNIYTTVPFRRLLKLLITETVINMNRR